MILWRVIAGSNADLRDFISHKLRGAPPRRSLTPLSREEWEGVSTYDTPKAASYAAREYHLGTHIAMLVLPEDGSMGIAQSRRDRTHYTLWAPADTLLRMVAEIVPVQGG